MPMPCDVPPAITTIQPSAGHRRCRYPARSPRSTGCTSSTVAVVRRADSPPSQSRVPTRSRTGTGAARAAELPASALASSAGQVGQPQRSRRGSQRRPGQPLGFGIAALGQQRQMDRPALERDAGEQRPDPAEIIGRDAVAAHRGQHLHQHPGRSAAGDSVAQIVQPRHRGDHPRIAAAARPAAHRVATASDHHVTGEPCPGPGRPRPRAHRDASTPAAGPPRPAAADRSRTRFP